MEEMSVLRRKSKRLVVIVGSLLVLTGLMLLAISFLFKPKVISPVQESSNVRVIFVTPHPTALEVTAASASATPKASSKPVSTPKPAPKSTPKSSASRSAETTP